jgi:hypothetical protein
MNWYKTFKSANALDDIFKETPEEKAEADRKARAKKISEQKVTEPYKLTLYRGFNLEPRDIKESMVLDPSRSEQKMLWFTHEFCRLYRNSPVQYAKNHGTVLLTYPLTCKVHFVRAKYDDGSERKELDKVIAERINHAENSKFMIAGFYCIELPDGWVFTYKDEKFIGCSIPLSITKNMLSLVVD